MIFYSVFLSFFSSLPLHPGQRSRPGCSCLASQCSESSWAPHGQSGRDWHWYGSQHVPTLNRLCLQPHLDWRWPFLPVLWPDGYDLQRGQHHDSGRHGVSEIPGDRKPSKIRYCADHIRSQVRFKQHLRKFWNIDCFIALLLYPGK